MESSFRSCLLGAKYISTHGTIFMGLPIGRHLLEFVALVTIHSRTSVYRDFVPLILLVRKFVKKRVNVSYKCVKTFPQPGLA